MLNFYMTPGSCSTGIHILLEELELVFGVYLVNLLAGDNQQADFLVINPKGTIPVLVLEDGRALTDFSSIAWWLGSQYPQAGLIPQDLTQQAEMLGWISYITGTVHQQAFTRIFTPERYCLRDEDKTEIEAKGREMVNNCFQLIEQKFSGRTGYLMEKYSIADAALFYVEFWADRTQLTLPEGCRRHLKLMQSRPAVRRVLAEEGYRIKDE